MPVKDYISQSGFFSLCIVVLLDRAIDGVEDIATYGDDCIAGRR